MMNHEKAMKVWENQFSFATSGRDATGVEVRKEAYGQENSPYGWDVDHKKPR